MQGISLLLKRSASAELLGILSLTGHAQAPDLDFEAKLRSLTRVVGFTKKTEDGVTEYDITFQQPVDHQHPNGPKFGEHIFLVHSGFDQPVLLETEGYEAEFVPYADELHRMLGAPNHLDVEYRYFGRSVPTSVDWKQLTVKNAADDLHDIVTAFKKIYRRKWISTGISKGGQAALCYKCFYPNDVAATVAYVAPITLAPEDPRINAWFNTNADPVIREKVRALQVAFLQREPEIIAALKPKASDYSIGLERAFEYGVLEFEFSFWQFGEDASKLPDPGSSVADLAKAFKEVGSMKLFADKHLKRNQPYYYQCMTELGFYNYDITRLKPYLLHVKDPSYLEFCPVPGVAYESFTMAFVMSFLQHRADHVVYVYGSNDPWSAAQVELLGGTDALKIMVSGGSHSAHLMDGTAEQRAGFYEAMDRWLRMKLTRL